MPKARSFLVPLSLFFLSFFIRLGFISKGPFHCDCLELALNAQKTLSTLKIHYLHIPGSPLTVVLAALNIGIFRLFSVNDPVWVVNFMAVYFSSLCVLVIFLATRELLNETTAVLAALFLMILPPFLSVSVYGKDTSPALFFALLSIYLLLKYLNTQKISSLILSGLSAGLCGAVRMADSLIVVPIFLLLLIKTFPGKSKRNYNLKSYGMFIASLLLPLLIFYVPFVKEVGIDKIIWSMNSLDNAKFLGFFSELLPKSADYIFASLTFWGVVFSLFGFYILFLKDKKAALFLAVWFLVLFFYYGNISVLAPRYLVIAFVPLVITSSYFFSELSQVSKLVKVLTLALFFVTLLWLFKDIYPVVEFRHKNILQPDFAQWVASKTEQNAIIMAVDEGIFINYYGKRTTLYPPISCRDKIFKDFGKNYMDGYLNNGIPVYMISSGLAYDFCGRLRNFLLQNYRLEFLGCHINEDWHHSCLRLDLLEECLFRISAK